MTTAQRLDAATLIAGRWITRAARVFATRLLGGALLGMLLGLVTFAVLRAVRGDDASWLWLPLLLLVAMAGATFVGFLHGVRAAARALVIDSGLVRRLVEQVRERGRAVLDKPRLTGLRGLLGSAMQPLYRTLLARFGLESSLFDGAPADAAERWANEWIGAWQRLPEWLVLGGLALVVVLAFTL